MCSFWLHNSKSKASQLLLKPKPIPRQEEQLTLLTLLKKNSNQQSLISADSRVFMKPDSNPAKYSQLCINFGFQGCKPGHLCEQQTFDSLYRRHAGTPFTYRMRFQPRSTSRTREVTWEYVTSCWRAGSTRREVLKEDTEHTLGKGKPDEAIAPRDSHLQEHIQSDGSALT